MNFTRSFPLAAYNPSRGNIFTQEKENFRLKTRHGIQLLRHKELPMLLHLVSKVKHHLVLASMSLPRHTQKRTMDMEKSRGMILGGKMIQLRGTAMTGT